MSSFRLRLFRGLVAIVAGLMIASFIMPWWIADVGGGYKVDIYGWGLRHSLEQLAPYVAADVTPFYQTVLAWIYLGVSVGLILYSTWLKGKRGRLLLGVIGLIYIIYVVIAVYIVITNRIADLNIPLQGTVDLGVAKLITSLRFGYYWAYAAGLTCIALALLRNKIIGKPKRSA